MILIHSSKTMRSSLEAASVTTPLLMNKIKPLATYLQTLTAAQLQAAMSISSPLAHKVHDTLATWSTQPDQQTFAIDSFVGDIYSGLRASTLGQDDRDYAQSNLRRYLYTLQTQANS